MIGRRSREAGRSVVVDEEDRTDDDKSRIDSVGGFRLPRYRFGIAVGGSGHRPWHAVDLSVYGPRMAEQAAGGARVDIFSVCGIRSGYVRQAGQFTYGSGYLKRGRCERCGWVVALNLGSVEQEIDLHCAVADGANDGLLRHIFTAILADLPPGRDAAPGHRSDLLAHAARHRPTMAVCRECARGASSPQVHGTGITICPRGHLVCSACTFSAGKWGVGDGDAMAEECVVDAPCSVLVALARHYDIVLNDPPGLR